MSQHYITIGTQQLHYLQWGSGPHLLLAFHGYGNDARIFSPFRQYLEQHYTILSIDLPYHGASQWPEDRQLLQRDLLDAIRTLMQQYSVEKISLLGYSMGGRVCMSIVEQMPDVIDRVGLIATDGLAINKLYYFCTRNPIGKRLFRHMLQKPERYISLVNLLRKLRIIDPTRHKFVMQHLQSPERRRFLLQVWPGMSHLIPAPAKLKSLIKRHRIPIFIFMGVYDRIMPPRLGEQFSKGLDTVKVFTFDKGHRVFDDTNAHEIARHFLS